MDWAQYLSLAIGFAVIGIVYFFLVFWPLIRIMHRVGRSGWWSLLVFVWPLGLWLLAYTRWPAIDPPSQ
jgi:uncharacterized membrane protein YhaH (DUF805 family)